MRTKFGFLGLIVAGLVAVSLASGNVVRADTTPTTPVTPVKHHHHHHVHGKIMSVASDGSTITIKVHHHHKKGSTATTPTTEEKTFKITSKTKVEIVSETGGKSPGSLTDLTPGKHVSIGEHEDVAHVITVGHHQHHKKKPTATS